MTTSINLKKNPPTKNPTAAGKKDQIPYPLSSALVMAGANSDQKDAAIMTPAAKPFIISKNF